MNAATSVAATSNSAARTSSAGSHGRTPNNRLAINAPETIAAGMPSANPTLTCTNAPRSTIPTTDARSAPSAMRTPISAVRRSTVYAVMP